MGTVILMTVPTKSPIVPTFTPSFGSTGRGKVQTTKKTDTNKAPLTKEEKAAEAKNLYMRQFIARVEAMMENFVEEFQINENLTSLDRRRFTGAGVRNRFARPSCLAFFR